MAKKEGSGKGTRKYGRHKRGASHAGQLLRSARNKTRRIEREARRQAWFKEHPVEHGKGRRVRRWGMARKYEVSS